MPDDTILRFDRITKAFDGRAALDGVSFDVRRGEVLALLGPNGAGKTTLLSLVLGFLRPTAGDVLVRGVSVRRDPRRAREGVGSVVAPAFHEYLSGWDNLRILTGYSAGVREAEIVDAVGFVGLGERIHDRVRAYSHGMRRRLALAQALLPAPDVVLLDEPEEGLDPIAITEMRRLIVRMNRERGVTVVLASHQLAGVEQTCERVAILDRGRLVFIGRWSELDGADATFRIDADDRERAAAVFRALGVHALGDDGLVSVPGGRDVADVVAALVDAGVRVRGVEPVRRTLEEVYVRAVAAGGAT